MAVTTHLVPTFTDMSARRRWLAYAILSVLAVHLLRKPESCIHGLD